MALEINIDGVDRAYAVRLIGGTASQAFHTESAAMAGVVSSGLIEVEDPDGSLDLVGWTQFNIVETTATPDRIATGWLANIDQTYGPFRVGPGRIHICETVDLNWYLTRIALEQGTPKRPAETDLARVTWLLGNASLNGRVYAGDLTDLTNNPVNLGEADYTDQFPIDVLTDICPVAGKTAYVTWDYTNNRAQLFYDLTTTTTYDSPAAISDGEGDANGTTVFAPRNDPVLHRVIEDGYSDVWLRWKQGIVHKHDAAFEAAHARRDLVLSTSRIGNPTTADAYATKALNAHNHETDSIDVEVEVSAEHVNDILEGHRLYYKSTHFTGFTSYAYTRVERRTVRQVDDQSRRFILGLQLSDRILSALPGGPPPSDFPKPPAAAAGIVQWKHADLPAGGSNNIVLDAAPVEDNYIWIGASRRGGAPTIHSDFTASPDGTFGPTGFYADGGASGYRIVAAGEDATIPVRPSGSNGVEMSYTIVEIAGVTAPAASPNHGSEAVRSWGTFPAATSFDAGTLTPVAGDTGIAMMLGSVGCSDFSSNGPTSVTPSSPWTELVDIADGNGAGFHPLHWVGWRAINTASGSYSTAQLLAGGPYNYGGDGGQTLFFPSANEAEPPAAGQAFGPVSPVEVPDGATYTFTLPAGFEFADNTLKVFVDRLDQTAAVTSYDGAARTFTLAFAPWGTDIIEVYGLGR